MSGLAAPARGYGPDMSLGVLGLVITIVVMVAIAVFILLFEKQRAKEIESDLGRQRRSDGRDDREG